MYILCGRDGRAAYKADTQGGKIVICALFRHGQIQGGDAVHAGDALVLDGLQQAAYIRQGGEINPVAQNDGAQQQHHAEHMVEGQGDQGNVILAIVAKGLCVHQIADEVPLGQHHSLAFAGGAGGKDDECRLISAGRHDRDGDVVEG